MADKYTCSECGCTFFHTSSLFNQIPASGDGWFGGYVCPDCRRELNERNRHEERMQAERQRQEEEERRFRERMEAEEERRREAELEEELRQSEEERYRKQREADERRHRERLAAEERRHKERIEADEKIRNRHGIEAQYTDQSRDRIGSEPSSNSSWPESTRLENDRLREVQRRREIELEVERRERLEQALVVKRATEKRIKERMVAERIHREREQGEVNDLINELNQTPGSEIQYVYERLANKDAIQRTFNLTQEHSRPLFDKSRIQSAFDKACPEIREVIQGERLKLCCERWRLESEIDASFQILVQDFAILMLLDLLSESELIEALSRRFAKSGAQARRLAASFMQDLKQWLLMTEEQRLDQQKRCSDLRNEKEERYRRKFINDDEKHKCRAALTLKAVVHQSSTNASEGRGFGLWSQSVGEHEKVQHEISTGQEPRLTIDQTLVTLSNPSDKINRILSFLIENAYKRDWSEFKRLSTLAVQTSMTSNVGESAHFREAALALNKAGSVEAMLLLRQHADWLESQSGISLPRVPLRIVKRISAVAVILGLFVPGWLGWLVTLCGVGTITYVLITKR